MTSLEQFQNHFSAGQPGAPWDNNPVHDFWYNEASSLGATPVGTPDGALRVAAFNACLSVLGDSVGGLSCHLYERSDDGSRERAPKHPQYYTVHTSPDDQMTSFEFYELMMLKLNTLGNMIGRNYATSRGPNTGIEWIDPTRATRNPQITKMSDGSLRFYYRDENDKEAFVSTADNSFFHVRAKSLDGLWGLSPLTLLRLQLQSADKSRRYGNKFFDNSMTPTGAFRLKTKLRPESFARLKASLSGGIPEAHRALILEDDMEFQPFSLSHADAQFLELRKFDRAEIASVMRVPLHMIQDLERATNNNIEHMSLEFVIHTLRPWLKRIEGAMSLRFIVRPGRYFAEFLVDDLLRADIKSRYEAYGKLIQHEIASSNEVRRMENWNPREGGDEYRNPLVNPKNGQQNNTLGAGEHAESMPFQHLVTAFAHDIAGKLNHAETKEVSKRVKHGGKDPDQFADWIAGFYTNKHAHYVDKAIGPICDALGVQASSRAACVYQIIREPVNRLVADAKSGLEWLENGAAAHYETFIKELAT